MGKGALLLVVAAIAAGGILLYQAEQTSMATFQDQAERQEHIVAREIARTGFNSIRSRIYNVEQDSYADNPNTPLSVIIHAVNGGQNSTVVQETDGGYYEAWMERRGVDAYRVFAVGHYGGAEHELSARYVAGNITTTPEEPGPPGVAVMDDTDDCSALFMQRFVPVVDRGEDTGINPSHGDEDGEYYQRNARYMRTSPVLVFSSGQEREITIKTPEVELPYGTRVGFILAIDEGCSLQDEEDVTPGDFDRRLYSLVAYNAGQSGTTGRGRAGFGQNAVGDLEEGQRALLETHADTNNEYVWRISFETDPDWTEQQLQEAKDNLSNADKSCDGFVCLDSYPEPNFSGFVMEFWLNEAYGAAHPGQHSDEVGDDDGGELADE